MILLSGHATAVDMIEHFQAVLDQVSVPDVVQLGMDGPNVNWKFMTILNDRIKEQHGVSLLNLGSCGLHVTHNSFQRGAEATGWRISSILLAMYRLFKDSPARREDYVNVTGSSRMPLKFVNHRWLENVPVCERAVEVWPNIVKYVQAVKAKKITNPKNASYDVLCEAVKDNVIIPKFQFFKSVAELLVPFLKDYQTSRPLVPFLCEDLSVVLRSVMRKFLKPEVLAEATTATKLVSIDVGDKSLHATYKNIDLGFVTQQALRSLSLRDKELMDFRMDCKEFLVTLLKRIMTKCPLSYPPRPSPCCS